VTIDELLEKIDLAEMVRQEGITLIPDGPRFKGCCPFHNEAGPSFVVYTNGSCYCFGCGFKGTAIDFLSKRRDWTVKEAITFLRLKYDPEYGKSIPLPTLLERLQKIASEEKTEKENREVLHPKVHVRLHHRVLSACREKGYDVVAKKQKKLTDFLKEEREIGEALKFVGELIPSTV
jgi:DNA primase